METIRYIGLIIAMVVVIFAALAYFSTWLEPREDEVSRKQDVIDKIDVERL